MSTDDQRIHLSDGTISALCGSGVARHVLHPLEGDATPLDPIDTSVLTANAEALLTGRAPAAMREMGQRSLDASARRLPPGFPELLRHSGIDPDGMLILALILPNELVTAVRGRGDDASVVAQIGFHGQDLTWISLARGNPDLPCHTTISWGDDHISMRRLPETVLTTLVGMPLVTVISHPALDPLGITITGIADSWDDERYIEIETSLHAQRRAEHDATRDRVRKILDRLVANTVDEDGIGLSNLGGPEEALVLDGHRPAKIGVNMELVRLHDDRAIEKLLCEQVSRWKRRTTP